MSVFNNFHFKSFISCYYVQLSGYCDLLMSTWYVLFFSPFLSLLFRFLFQSFASFYYAFVDIIISLFD